MHIMAPADKQALEFYLAELKRLSRFMPPNGDFCGDKRMQSYYRESFTHYLQCLLQIHRENTAPTPGGQCCVCAWSHEFTGVYRCSKNMDAKASRDDAPVACAHFKRSDKKAEWQYRLDELYPMSFHDAMYFRGYEIRSVSGSRYPHVTGHSVVRLAGREGLEALIRHLDKDGI